MMRVTLCYSTGRTETTVLRGLDDDQRRVIIGCPWAQSPAETLRVVLPQLTEEEAAEVRAAFDLDRPGGAR